MQNKNKDILRRGRIVAPGKRGTGPVIYWMERDQRLHDNWALLYAQQEAVIRKKPLIILFCLRESLSLWNDTQIFFMLEGLKKVKHEANTYSISFFCFKGNPEEILPWYCQKTDVHALVTDFSPLKEKQESLSRIVPKIQAPIVEVDTHNIVPAWEISTKKEYAAYTIRPKIKRLLSEYLTDFQALIAHPFQHSNTISDHRLFDLNEVDQTQLHYKPGTSEAAATLDQFLNEKLAFYEKRRNDPTTEGQSDLSPYLHFGQLSPQRTALKVISSQSPQPAKDSFLEELIIRRELSDNFCLYEKNYDSIRSFPRWAIHSLEEHLSDKRDFIYSLEDLEHARTHEELWNSCQRSLVKTHKLHGYMRMYWAKKLLEWTKHPEEALAAAIYLNDTYSLDGRDPNGYAGIAWSIGGVHDRAWPDRKIFGKVRYMNENGCRRKFDINHFINRHS